MLSSLTYIQLFKLISIYFTTSSMAPLVIIMYHKLYMHKYIHFSVYIVGVFEVKTKINRQVAYSRKNVAVGRTIKTKTEVKYVHTSSIHTYQFNKCLWKAKLKRSPDRV